MGIYVSGHDVGNGDEILIEGTSHEVATMRRIHMEGESLTLIVEAREQG